MTIERRKLSQLPESTSSIFDDLFHLRRGTDDYKIKFEKLAGSLGKLTTVFHVSKSTGSDTLYNGLSENAPFATIAKALTSAPSTNYVIKIIDNETYNENVSLTGSKGFLYFPYATINGQVSMDADTFMVGHYIKNSANDCIEAGAFGGQYFFCIDILHTVGNVLAVNHQNVLNRPIGFVKLHIMENPTNVAASSIAITAGLAPLPCDVQIETIQIIGTGSSPRVISYGAVSATGVGRIKVGKIITESGVTNTTGAYCYGDGQLDLTIESGNCTTAYQTVGSVKLVLIGNSDLQGAVTEGSSVPIETRIARFQAPAIIGTDYQYLGALGGKMQWLDLAHTSNSSTIWLAGTGTPMTLPPTVTQGIAYPALSTTHTPKTSKVKVSFSIQGTQGAGSTLTIVAVFVGGNLVCYCGQQIPSNNIRIFSCEKTYSVTPNSPITFHVRIGHFVGSTVAINGQTGGALTPLESNLLIEDMR